MQSPGRERSAHGTRTKPVSYLEAIVADTIPEVMDDLAAAPSHHGIELSAEATPLMVGSWIGGDRDGNPNVTADITHEVLRLQHLTAFKIAIIKIDDLIMALSSSTVVTPVSGELAASIKEDLRKLPGLDPRVKELNSVEPMRLKLTCVKAKLIDTHARVTADRSPTSPGVTTRAATSSWQKGRQPIAVTAASASRPVAATISTGTPPSESANPAASAEAMKGRIAGGPVTLCVMAPVDVRSEPKNNRPTPRSAILAAHRNSQ